MASQNNTLIDGVELTTSAVTLYTADGSGNGTRINAISVINTSGGAQTYSLYIVPNGESATNPNALVLNRSVNSNATDLAPEALNQLIPPGGTIQALASANTAISVRASGIEFTDA